MKKILVIILLFFNIAQAEWIEVTEKHKHLGDVSVNKSCSIATTKAQKKALTETLGLKVSSEVVTNCSETEGEYECERNQLSLFELKISLNSLISVFHIFLINSGFLST